MRKGIVLAGGSGTRLMPVTKYVCKQLLPVYDKPLIYFPLYTLAKSGIREILIISTPETTPILESNLGNLNELGLKVSYAVQSEPKGIAHGIQVAEDTGFIGSDDFALILGDNIFFGNQVERFIRDACMNFDYNTVFGYPVKDPERYGVVRFAAGGRPVDIIEKPKEPPSNYAVPGIYFYRNDVLKIVRKLKPSDRGELEITDLNRTLMKKNDLEVVRIGVGNAWMDCGTFDSLNDASNFIRTMEDRTGMTIGNLETLSPRR